MKRLAISFSLLVALSCSAAFAQQPGETEVADEPVQVQADAEYQLTPEMYRYLIDLQRYGGPQDITRQRAQLKAQQRMDRLAAMKWYGMSNSRPHAGVTPFVGTYSPRWVSTYSNIDLWRDQGHHRTYYTAGQGAESTRR